MREVRTIAAKIALETREIDGSEARFITGYAAEFDQPTELWPGHSEVVRRSAFDVTLAGDSEDPAALWNHNADIILGRRSAGTLKLSVDDRGLRYEVPIPEGAYMREKVVGPISRGEVYQSSFQFEAVDAETTVRADGSSLRELRAVKLYDVSPVVFPAYPSTSTQLRSFQGNAIAEFDEILRALRLAGLTEAEARSKIDLVFGEVAPEPKPNARGSEFDVLTEALRLREREAALS